MKFAIYNPITNKVRTWVTDPKGALPEGFEFRLDTEVPPDATTETAEQPVTPEEVRTWALREVCLERGLESAIEDALSKLDPLTKAKAENRWKSKPTISRRSPYILTLQHLLEWSDEFVDTLFRDANAKPL